MFRTAAKSNVIKKRTQRLSAELLESRLVLSTVSILGDVLTYVAASGEFNNVQVTQSGNNITFFDSGATITAAAPFTIVNANEVRVSVAGMESLNLALGDMNDSAMVDSSVSLWARIDGGEGNDSITGGVNGDLLLDGPGNDFVDGGGGVDIWGGERDTNITLTNSALSAGGDVDTYANLHSVYLTGGPGDNVIDASAVTVGSGLSRVRIDGAEGNDTLIGSAISDTLFGGPGNDSIDGGGGSDLWVTSEDSNMTLTNTQLFTSSGVDSYTNTPAVYLTGGASNNTIDASGITFASGIASLRIDGAGGDDTLIGSPLDDLIFDGTGSDSVDGGSGIDLWVSNENANARLTDAALFRGADVDTFAAIEELFLNGGGSANVLNTGAATANSGIGLLRLDGKGGDDYFITTPDPAIDVRVFGLQQFDTLDLSRHYPNIPVVNVTGPGNDDGQMGDAENVGFFDNVNRFISRLGDFNGDDVLDCDDIDALVVEISSGSHSALYDITDDGRVDLADRDLWLAAAGTYNLPSGNPYLLGDANLDGTVDGVDFIEWNENKFTNTPAWCRGDFNADGLVDGLDFIEWNANKFTASDVTLIPNASEVHRVEAPASRSSSQSAETSELQTNDRAPVRSVWAGHGSERPAVRSSSSAPAWIEPDALDVAFADFATRI